MFPEKWRMRFLHLTALIPPQKAHNPPPPEKQESGYATFQQSNAMLTLTSGVVVVNRQY